MRKLRVFLCHATEDKPAVRTLYASLKSIPWIDPWLDEENLLPGQDWDLEIYKATRDADAIIICLSKVSVKKDGYVNKEIRRALEIADEKPEGAIYVIPLRLDDCIPSFERLKKLHWLDYFTPNAHERLLKSLRLRADTIGVGVSEKKDESILIFPSPFVTPLNDSLDLYRFVEIDPPQKSKASYPFFIGKYPVTNAQYERFLNAPDFTNPIYWLEFPKFDENCKAIGDWGKTAVEWLRRQLEESNSKVLLPLYWNDKNFGKLKPNHPVVGITWYEANAYCEWLFQNWSSLDERRVNLTIRPQVMRLPLESEWVTAAGGDKPEERFVWDESGKSTDSLKEILRRANIRESGVGHTTPVRQYPLGKSPFGVMDMTGNIWEWQANLYGEGPWPENACSLRGGSWDDNQYSVHVFDRNLDPPSRQANYCGFRVVIIQK